MDVLLEDDGKSLGTQPLDDIGARDYRTVVERHDGLSHKYGIGDSDKYNTLKSKFKDSRNYYFYLNLWVFYFPVLLVQGNKIGYKNNFYK